MHSENCPPVGAPVHRPLPPARAGRERDRSPSFWSSHAALGKELLRTLLAAGLLLLPAWSGLASQDPTLTSGEAAWRRLLSGEAASLAAAADSLGDAARRDPRLACCLAAALNEAGDADVTWVLMKTRALTDLLNGCQASRDGQPAAAESLLAAARDSFAAEGETEGTLVARQELGGLLLETGRPQEAMEQYAASLATARELGRPLAATYAHLQLGRLLVRTRQVEEAAAHLEEATAQAAALGVPLWQGDAEIALSVVARFRMDLDAALAHRERALAAYEAAGNLQGQARALHYIATVRIFRGELTTAMGLLHRALALAREAADPGEESGCLGDLANLNYLLGDLDLALAQYGEALELGADARRAGFWRSNLGSILTDQEHYDAALEQLTLAREALAAAGDHRSEVSTRNAMGHCYCRMGRYEQGLAELEQGAALAREWQIPMEEAYALLATGRCQLARGNLADAAGAFARAHALAETTGFYDILEGALLGRARVLRRQGDAAAALPFLEEAMASAEEVRRRSGGSPRVQSGSFGEANDVYAESVEILEILHAREPEAGHDRQAFAVAQRARARSLLDLLAEAEVDLRCQADPAYREREAAIQERIVGLTEQLLAATPAERTDVERELAEQEDALDLLEAEFRRADPRYAELRYPQPTDLPELQSSVLDEGELLLEYALGDSASHVWAVTRHGFRFLRLAPRAQLEAEVRDLLPLLRDYNLTGNDPAYYVAAAAALSASLLEPLASELAAARHLIVVPDGILHYLPFEALLSGFAPDPSATFADLPYLVQRADVSYAPSISTLARLRSTERTANKPTADLLLVGDPVLLPGDEASVFARTAGGGRPAPLPFAAEELTILQQLVPAGHCRLLRGADACPAHLRRAAADGDYRWVHVAAHGLFNELRPQYSGLLLSRCPEGDDDGFVSVADVFGLELPCELVTLSACSSALGEQVTGEGLVGLTRGFLYAGAASVVAALWDVPDHSTAELMHAFYAGLVSGERAGGGGRTAALAAAKRSLLRGEVGEAAGVSRRSHPYFWAAFVLSGDGR
jgi:CHAT domain-containing protein